MAGTEVRQAGRVGWLAGEAEGLVESGGDVGRDAPLVGPEGGDDVARGVGQGPDRAQAIGVVDLEIGAVGGVGESEMPTPSTSTSQRIEGLQGRSPNSQRKSRSLLPRTSNRQAQRQSQT